MKIEELMPQIRAGAKVRLPTWPKSEYMYYVVDFIATENCEFGGFVPYTGFLHYSKCIFWIIEMRGDLTQRDDWELYNEPTQSV